jgi:hypothetical protein
LNKIFFHNCHLFYSYKLLTGYFRLCCKFFFSCYISNTSILARPPPLIGHRWCIVLVLKMGLKTEYIRCVCAHKTRASKVTPNMAFSKPCSLYAGGYVQASDPTANNMLREVANAIETDITNRICSMSHQNQPKEQHHHSLKDKQDTKKTLKLSLITLPMPQWLLACLYIRGYLR